MRFIGHVSTAVLAAGPVIFYRKWLPPWLGDTSASDLELLFFTSAFAVLPDIDILLARFTPIKHRGYLTHSLFSVLLGAGLVSLALWLGQRGYVAQLAFISPLHVLLAALALGAHLLGDALTKTGIPLLTPGKRMHVPVIGGHAAYDNVWLNLIPFVAAGYMIYYYFGLDPDILKRFGKFRHFFEMLE